jgi:hypothetical protein
MSNMLRKKDVFTVITPIPGFIPRQLALDILHSHSEVITLNPLVLEHKPISAPRNAAADEFYSTWYEITQRIQFVPGVGNLGSGKITFTGCFHDMPWGLQTHVYAPFNVDMRSKYQIGGNQPGLEPPEQRELGLGAPADGLYLREDIEIKCNIAMVSFVKSQAKAANKAMVQRIVKKAELLDAGVLKAMMEDGKLKTINPNDRSRLDRTSTVSYSHSSGMPSPPAAFQQPQPLPYQLPASPSHPYYAPHMYQAQGQPAPYNYDKYTPPVPPAPVELPADIQQYQYYHSQPQSRSPQPQEFTPNYRQSASSSDPRWSLGQPSPSLADTHRTSASSVLSGAGSFGHPSPGLQRTAFAPELAAHTESRDEHK